ncbi:MAG: DrmE family protein [Bacillota bacterium]
MIDKLRKIVNECKIYYGREEVSHIAIMQCLEEFLSEFLGGLDEKKSAVVLHTGSTIYNCIVIFFSACLCGISDNISKDDLINTLVPGAKLLMGKDRVEFLGIEDIDFNGKNMSYFVYKKGNSEERRVPIEFAPDFVIYEGEAKTLGSKGIRIKKNFKKEFMNFIRGESSDEISTIINKSIILVMDKQEFSNIFENLVIEFNNNKMKFNEYATAAYYTETTVTYYSGNPSKAMPMFMVTSRGALARKILIENRKKILGIIAIGEKYWKHNTELSSIMKSTSIKFNIVCGRMKYENYMDWINVDSQYFICTKSVLEKYYKNRVIIAIDSKKIVDLYKEFDKYKYENIENIILNTKADSEYANFMRLFSNIRRELLDSDETNRYIMNVYSLIKLYTTAVFPLEKMYELIDNKTISAIRPLRRLEEIKLFNNEYYGKLRCMLDELYEELNKWHNELFKVNMKFDKLKELMFSSRVKSNVVVIAYSYYETILREICHVKLFEKIKFVTLKSALKYDNIDDPIIVTTQYYDEQGDFYSNVVSRSVTMLAYSFEYAYYIKPVYLNYVKYLNEFDKINWLKADNQVDHNMQDTIKNDVLDNIHGLNRIIGEIEISSLLSEMHQYHFGDGVAQMSKVSYIASLDTGEKCFFTANYKAYKVVEMENDNMDHEYKIDVVDAKEISVGDCVIFKKISESKDLVLQLLELIISNNLVQDEIKESNRLVNEWKNAIKDYLNEKQITYKDFAERLNKIGCQRTHMAVRSWVDEGIHVVGPVEREIFISIGKAMEDNTFLSKIDQYYHATTIIRNYRKNILGYVGDYIKHKKNTNMQNRKILDLIEQNMSRISNVVVIDLIQGIEEEIPSYLANKPINL